MNFNDFSIDELFNTVQRPIPPSAALMEVMTIFQKKSNMPVFSRNWIELETDIAETTEKIDLTLKGFPDSNGLFFGLDTLNMKKGQGQNIFLQVTSVADLSGDSWDWIFKCTEEPFSWLLRGLYSAHLEYRHYSESDFEYADYAVFLIYSGIVLSSALKQKLNRKSVVAWGFHDGDMFKFAQHDGSTLILNPFPTAPCV
jgi:hypothetical protein